MSRLPATASRDATWLSSSTTRYAAHRPAIARAARRLPRFTATRYAVPAARRLSTELSGRSTWAGAAADEPAAGNGWAWAAGKMKMIAEQRLMQLRDCKDVARRVRVVGIEASWTLAQHWRLQF